MLNKRVILIIGAVILAILFFYPKNFIHLNSGKGYAMRYKEEWSCLGFKHIYYPDGCMDCIDVTNCYGLLFNKHCATRDPLLPESGWTKTVCLIPKQQSLK